MGVTSQENGSDDSAPRFGKGSGTPRPGSGGVRPGAGRPSLTQAQKDARKRDRDSIEKARRPAIALLLRTMRNPTADPTLRVKCATEILDRAGMPKSVHLEGSMDEGDRELMSALRGELGSVIEEIRANPEAFAIRAPDETLATNGNGKQNGSGNTIQ